ncbi:MAG: T9SS type A sorting domain-containing protein, partial [Candidatus Eisenbacteria bacterium]
ATGADLAWSATFNGGQDIYFMRITPPPAAVADARVPRFRLDPAYPNPFSGSTTIRFDVPPAGARVKLEIFDPAGHRVATLADGFMTGGTQLARWSGTDASGRVAGAGVYFCRYQAAGESATRKLMLIR